MFHLLNPLNNLNNMETSERIKRAVAYAVGIGVAPSQKEFGVLLGVSNGSYFSQLLNGKKRLPDGFFERLIVLLPNISRDWLLFGEGEMLRPVAASSSVVQTSHGDNSPNVNGGCASVVADGGRDVKFDLLIAKLDALAAAVDELRADKENTARLLAIMERIVGGKE